MEVCGPRDDTCQVVRWLSCRLSSGKCHCTLPCSRQQKYLLQFVCFSDHLKCIIRVPTVSQTAVSFSSAQTAECRLSTRALSFCRSKTSFLRKYWQYSQLHNYKKSTNVFAFILKSYFCTTWSRSFCFLSWCGDKLLICPACLCAVNVLFPPLCWGDAHTPTFKNNCRYASVDILWSKAAVAHSCLFCV